MKALIQRVSEASVEVGGERRIQLRRAVEVVDEDEGRQLARGAQGLKRR